LAIDGADGVRHHAWPSGVYTSDRSVRPFSDLEMTGWHALARLKQTCGVESRAIPQAETALIRIAMACGQIRTCLERTALSAGWCCHRAQAGRRCPP
jgi:hypothetical protein